jgi:hypothetical protein
MGCACVPGAVTSQGKVGEALLVSSRLVGGYLIMMRGLCRRRPSTTAASAFVLSFPEGPTARAKGFGQRIGPCRTTPPAGRITARQ